MPYSSNCRAPRGDFALGPIQRTVPIYVFGDSHALGYSHITLREEVTGTILTTRTKYIPSGFTGQSFWSAHGGLNPELLAALEYEGLLRDGRALHFSMDRLSLSIARATEIPQAPPLIVISCGEIDVRSALLPLLKNERDFIPPGESLYPHTGKPLVPFDFCQRLVEERMNPLLEGLLKFRSIGFTRTYLHCIVPPTLNEQRFPDLHGYDCPIATRYKAAKLFNDYLSAQCRKRGIPFLDVWPETTRNGYLLPKYELDGVHLCKEATRISLRLLAKHCLNETWFAVNYPRYDLFYRRCCGIDPPAPPETVRESTVDIEVPTAMATIQIASRPSLVRRSIHWILPGFIRRGLRGFQRRMAISARRSQLSTQAGVPSAGVVPAAVQIPAPRRSIVRRSIPWIVPGFVRRALRNAQRRMAPSGAALGINNSPAVAQAPQSLTEASNVPPAICTGYAPTDVKLPPIPWLRSAVEEFRSRGLCRLSIGRDMAERWKRSLSFDLDVGNSDPRWDWAGPTRQPFNKNMFTAVPPLEMLSDIHGILTHPEMEQLFIAIMGCQVSVLNCRPVRSLPHGADDEGLGPQSWHCDGCPAGIIRGIVYLTDVDENGGPFEYKDENGAVQNVTGPTGTFFIFDANRLFHRGKPPRARERIAIDLILQSRSNDESLSILYAGMNHWPADPFQYSIDGMTCYPQPAISERSYHSW
jgi:hypothetical protein